MRIRKFAFLRVFLLVVPVLVTPWLVEHAATDEHGFQTIFGLMGAALAFIAAFMLEHFITAFKSYCTEFVALFIERDQ